ncbi:SRPBCC domain-containing protein [Tropicimonas sp. TH_r6]|uniref:SRPBCC family protein n=1 Tax=Tropicimonas sp. TH_r6 TaxID=3082085 RepID=UPI002955147C|nr:SRPBCC domain-containing protein [Tropicimonas sp. TH_r6]MDV7143191.1 SRPBCC domain-containing protein [Tropicimonas sp. TH_r6]
MTEITLNKTIFLPADKARVWAFLTDPEKLAAWFHKPAVPLGEGTSYEMFGTQSGERLMWGEVISARPHDYLEYTFEIAPLQGHATRVAWTLEAVPGGTRLSLVHSGLPEGEAGFGLVLALDEGWDSHLGRLRTNAPDLSPEKTV